MEAVAELEQLLAKEAWASEDCRRVEQLLGQVRDPARKFREMVSRSGGSGDVAGAAAVKFGIARYMLCQFAEALSLLVKGTDNKERRFYQARCLKQLRQYTAAVECYQRAEERGWEARQVAIELAEAQCLAGQVSAAAKTVERFAKSSQEEADWHYAQGLVLEMQGDYSPALASYETARRLRPGHVAATFRMAYFYDLHGDEEAAMELYKECIGRHEADGGSVGVQAHALMNMAVLFEDTGRYDDAARCLRRVLAGNPSHARARLFLKDVQASKTMAFDEDEAKRQAKRNDLLAIPITDFELSVRARNCLKKMNIRTLGDLLHVTEQDLLSYKNFGETSLSEIKIMLTSKNLRLGQMREDANTLLAEPEAEAAPEAAVNEGVSGTPLSQIEFSVRSRKALERLGVKTMGDLANKTETELMACRNFGQTSLNEVQQRLAEYGMKLREG